MRQGQTIQEMHSRRVLFETTKSGDTCTDEKEKEVNENGKHQECR